MIRPGIEHLCDLYRTKAAQLSRDLLGLKEAVASSQEALLEKQQENRQLEAQVRGAGGLVLVVGWAGLALWGRTCD